VLVSWDTTGAGDAALFVFRWTEIGGPPVSPPTTRGAGERLIKAGLAGSGEASVALTYAEDGVRCEIQADLAGVQEEH
jgi:two-component sensor histidine kinase